MGYLSRVNLHSPGPIGDTTASTGAFTTISGTGDITVGAVTSSATDKFLNISASGAGRTVGLKLRTFGSGYGFDVVNDDVNSAALRFTNAAGTHLFGIGRDTPSFNLTSDFKIQWGTNVLLHNTADTILLRDAANTLAMRNGLTPQSFRVYDSYVDASNYSYFGIVSDGNNFSLAGVAAGTGAFNGTILGDTAHTLTLRSSALTITGGHMLFSADNTYDIGAAGATRPRNIYAGGTVTCTGFTSTGNIFAPGLVTTNYGSIAYLSDGVVSLCDWAGTSFGRLQLGGATSSFPALKRSTTYLQGRLADDSAFCPIQGKLTTDSNATTGLTAGVLAALTNATIEITDASGQLYRVPCII